MAIPSGSPRMRITLFVCAGLIVAGSILVWAAGEDDDLVAFALALAFGAGAFGVVIDERGGRPLLGAIQVGVALALAAMLAGEAPVFAGNAALVVGVGISLLSVLSASLTRIRSGKSSHYEDSLGF